MGIFQKPKIDSELKISPELNEYLDHIFDTIDPNIKLDDEQKAAVVADDKYSLIIAGAGTGKTTTVAAKVKYLVDIKRVNPEKILVMSYTKKATEELCRRINVDFNIPANVTTFHSLGYRYLRVLNPSKKFVPLDENCKDTIFLDFLREKIFPYQERLQEMMSLFNDKTIRWGSSNVYTYGRYFREHFSEFNNFDPYFESYIEKKVSETDDVLARATEIADRLANSEYPRTAKNERTRSKGEAIIANFLYFNGIDYAYEKVYDELMDDFKIYRPDFTVDIGGEKIYIEYFGLSGSALDNNSYNRIRQKKEAFHRSNHNKFIALDYKPNRGYLIDLKAQLESYGVVFHPAPIEEIYRRLLRRNPLAEFFNLKNFLYETIEIIKSSEKVHSSEDVKKFCADAIANAYPGNRETMRKQYEWIIEFWNYHNKATVATEGEELIDFNDMIKRPLSGLGGLDPDFAKFEYVIVDEYQDISATRYELLRATVDRCNAKLMVVGDDWQSIYSFMGGKIRYIYDFNFFFPNAKRYFITRTYRNSQSLINYAGEFIMRNEDQTKKSLISSKDQSDPISILGCDYNNRVDMLKRTIRAIHARYPEDSVLVLSYTNFAIRTILYDPDLRDSAENKVGINDVPNFYFDLMTIHKAKGLTYDWVIIAPLPKNFPHDPFSKFWMIDIFRNYPEKEQIEYPEFRRLFYVALTRCRKKVIIMCDKVKARRSRYINEIEEIIKDKNKQSGLF